MEQTDGNNIKEELVGGLLNSMKMILEYACTLPMKERLELISQVDSALEEISEFANDLNLHVDEIGEQDE